MIYYISPTGDNSNDGSEATPWETMAYAYSNSADNDTIHCLAGTYTMVSQTFTSNRDIVGDDPKTTIFDGGGNPVGWTIPPEMTISNLHFTNLADAALFYSVNRILHFTNCIISDFTSAGYMKNVFFMPSGGSLFITSCIFYDIISTYDNPNAGYGAMITSRGGTVSIINSTFYFDYNPATPNYIIPVGHYVNGNVFTSKNNIFVNIGTTSIFKAGGVTMSEDSSNNCIYGYSSIPVMDDTIEVDPLLIDPVNENFNLAPDSPCIDVGVLI